MNFQPPSSAEVEALRFLADKARRAVPYLNACTGPHISNQTGCETGGECRVGACDCDGLADSILYQLRKLADLDGMRNDD